MAPATMIANEEAVVETIKKRLARTGPEGVDKAVRFSEHLVELQRLVCALLMTFPIIPSIPAVNYGQSCIFCCGWPRRVARAEVLQVGLQRFWGARWLHRPSFTPHCL